MNLSQLEVFVAIVERGSLLEAAESVSLTPSAVSHSLRKLESELGVTLLERSQQGIALTPIGEEILYHARSVLAQVEIIRQKTGRERGLSIGKLRLGFVPNIGSRLVTGIIRDFQYKYPDIELILFEGNPTELLQWLDQRVIDIGTVLLPERYPLTTPLTENQVKVVLAAHHPLASYPTLDYEMLKDIAFIGPKAEYEGIAMALRQRGVHLPRLRYEVSTFSTIFAMVREGMGVSLIPNKLIEPELDGIVERSFSPQILIRVHLAASIRSPATEAFLSNASRWAKNHGFFPRDLDELPSSDL
jgi:DNA-binding transcriptional LysR family regulator